MPLERRTGVFRAFAQVLNRSFTLREALDGALPRIVELAEAEAGWIFFHDVESDTFSLAADVNLPPALAATGRRRMAGECRCMQMLREGRLRQAVNLIDCVRLEQAMPDAPERHQHATIPLRSPTEVPVGILNLLLPPGRALDQRDLDVLEALGHDVAVAIQRGRLLEAVRDKEATTRDLMQRLLTAQEEERRRIAQDLHDHAGQTMTALIIQLAHLSAHLQEMDRPAIALELERFRTVAERSLDDLHKLVYDLRPLILDDYGLAAAVRAYVDTHLTPSGLEVGLKIIGLEQRPPRDVETAAYRIIQEAATNTLRHAKAAQLEIRVDRRDGWLIVMVRDDGQGFVLEDAEPKKSLGVQGMRERAQLVGGHLQVLSVPGAGTTVLARLPLHKGQ
jgi:signal transduction histidine kinase